jgi:hypothetical protein
MILADPALQLAVELGEVKDTPARRSWPSVSKMSR